jgi:hypothetical protein
VENEGSTFHFWIVLVTSALSKFGSGVPDLIRLLSYIAIYNLDETATKDITDKGDLRRKRGHKNFDLR